MKKHNLILSLLSLAPAVSTAAVSFTGTAINQTFTGFDGLTAPIGWDASGFSDGEGFSENEGFSTGGVTGGGTYAFDTGFDGVALGVQPTAADFTPGYYQLEVVNDSGAPLVAVNIGYDGYYLNNEGRGNIIRLSYSLDGISFTEIDDASFVSPQTADENGWTLGISYSGEVAAAVPVGESFFIRFDGNDFVGGGSRDEYAIDNVTFEVVPEPSAALLSGIALLGLLRRRR